MPWEGPKYYYAQAFLLEFIGSEKHYGVICCCVACMDGYIMYCTYRAVYMNDESRGEYPT